MPVQGMRRSQVESLETVLEELKKEFPGVTFWWGRATEHWWALAGNRGLESKTLDGLRLLVRGALDEIKASAATTQSSAPPRYAPRAPGPHVPGSAHRPAGPPRRRSRIDDPFSVRPGRFRRFLGELRRFFLSERRGRDVGATAATLN